MVRYVKKNFIGLMVNGRRPSVEDDLWWETTFSGRRPSEEDELRWKTIFGGRRLSVEDNLQWKMTFGGKRPSVEDDIWWRRTFGGHISVRNLKICPASYNDLYLNRRFFVFLHRTPHFGLYNYYDILSITPLIKVCKIA